MIQLAGQVVPVKLNPEKGAAEVAKQYGVHGYPTILFINSSGDVEGKIVGYRPAGEFAQRLRYMMQAHHFFPDAQARYKKDPNDVEAITRLAAAYAWRGDEEHAKSLLAEAEVLDSQNAKGFLPVAYNALADVYRENKKYDAAIAMLEKTVKLSKQPAEIAYAHISLALNYQAQKLPEVAATELKAVLALPDAPKDLKKQAQQLLDKMKEAQNGG